VYTIILEGQFSRQMAVIPRFVGFAYNYFPVPIIFIQNVGPGDINTRKYTCLQDMTLLQFNSIYSRYHKHDHKQKQIVTDHNNNN